MGTQQLDVKHVDVEHFDANQMLSQVLETVTTSHLDAALLSAAMAPVRCSLLTFTDATV